MKKLFSLILLTGVALSLTGCAKTRQMAPGASDTNVNPPKDALINSNQDM